LSGASPLDLADVPVLVTGGAGFIGSHLVDALVERGAQVRVLDNFVTGRAENLAAVSGRIEIVEGDIRDADSCRAACHERRFVFHQAALGSVPRSLEDPATSLAVNVQGSVNLFAAARRAGVERIVYASSSSVYGDSRILPRREGEEGEPLSPYALSKSMGEQIAGVFGRCYGLESVGLRYFNVYGPRQDPGGPYAAVIPRFFRARLTGELPVIHGDGTQSRDFTYVGDAVAANLLALAAETADGSAFNVANGRRTTLLELDRRIADLTGGGPPASHGPQRPGDVKHAEADLAAASRRLAYRATVDLTTGLERALGYYQEQMVAAPVD
jgi:nucleoside-diphosphate-sugar epimerase